MKDFNACKLQLPIFLLLISLGCVSNTKNCRLTNIKTLYSDVSIHAGVDTSYANTVLIEDFSRECLDSSTIVDIAQKYRDTVKSPMPVDFVAFYSSNKDFIPNESSQDMKKIDQSCLVKIGFDHKTKRPKSFTFYNNKGDMIYSGDLWKPNN